MKRLLMITMFAVFATILFGVSGRTSTNPSPGPDMIPGAPKTYQVTGPVLELTADMIVVKKGNDRWEIARDAATKVTGDLKVGAKVTVEYRMTATAIDVKAR